MEFGIFQQFRKLYPVLDVVELVRTVIRVPPKSWGLMPAA